MMIIAIKTLTRDPEITMSATIHNLPAAHIVPGNNDRKTFDLAALSELAASISAHGLAQPITVRRCGMICDKCRTHRTDAKLADPALDFSHDWACGGSMQQAFQIVAGERRFRACAQVLGWKEVPCIVRELTDEQASAIMLAENTSRTDLDPVEEANAYQERITRFNWAPAKVAEVAGVSEDVVRRRLLLLGLHTDIQHMVAKKHLPLGHAEALTKLDSNRQMIAFRIYREAKAMPLNTFLRVVNDLYAEQAQDALFDLETFWMQHAASIAATPVRGKNAVVNVPTRDDLPQPEIKATDTTSAVIMRYILHLDSAGKRAEAAIIGTLYKALIHSNSMALPEAI